MIENPAVSGRHARVFREGDDFVVEDLQSTNGTFVNEKRVTRQTLQDGDVVLVGKHKLVFDRAGGDDAPAEAGPATLPDMGGTMYLDTKQHRAMLGSLKAQVAAAKEAGAPAKGAEGPAKGAEAPAKGVEAPAKGAEAPAKVAAPQKVAVLRVVSGRADQSEYRLRSNTTLIGKSDTAVVRLKGWFKPKVALAIARTGDRYVATPLGGKTLVNGEPLQGRRDLKDGDVLQVSGLVLEFSLPQ
ncbi:MAG: hypothetical protein A3H97_21810 [Acidobacteria bacterium RIFCSPLOWO2_02_FULL_65_29]|nr:MAG: hypothetical protein A3H97_21810 [Acidobacteria bacterium RIFCSPLOWO2_02_FULL_65_29]